MKRKTYHGARIRVVRETREIKYYRHVDQHLIIALKNVIFRCDVSSLRKARRCTGKEKKNRTEQDGHAPDFESCS